MGSVTFDEIEIAAAVLVIDVGGERKNVAVLLEGDTGGDFGAGFFRSFGNNCGARQTRNDTVSSRKIFFLWRICWRIFAQDTAVLQDTFGERPLRWTEHFVAASDDGPGDHFIFQRRLVCNRVDPVGKTADDDYRIWREKSNKRFCLFPAVLRWVARADDADKNVGFVERNLIFIR